MAGYTCTTCRRNTKLPDFCCGSSMISKGTYYCPQCKEKSMSPQKCSCGTDMIQA